MALLDFILKLVPLTILHIHTLLMVAPVLVLEIFLMA